MKQLQLILFILIFSLQFSACKKDSDEDPQPELKTDIPEFYKSHDEITPVFSVIGSAANGISQPQDLDFNQTRANELWIINKGTENSGGSTVMFSNVGSSQQTFDYRKDGNAWHFMALPSALSFNNAGNWATSSNIFDANHRSDTFTGPTLWSGDLNIYAKDPGPGKNGSHLDMLHGSPFSMGIESEINNVFWVFDGYNNHIVRYDFAADHGPGNDDHSDGKIHRYSQVKVLRNPEVPSHLVLDKEKKWLYCIDGGNRRVLRMNIKTGRKLKDLPMINEDLAEHFEMTDVVWEEFLPASFGLKQPCGIDIKDNRLFISDFETGEIICLDINSKKELGRIQTGNKGITGIKIGNDNKLWFVNSIYNQLVRIDTR